MSVANRLDELRTAKVRAHAAMKRAEERLQDAQAAYEGARCDFLTAEEELDDAHKALATRPEVRP